MNRLRVTRFLAGKTQAKLAAEIGTSKVLISMMEHDVLGPGVQLGKAVAEALYMPVAELFPGLDEKPPEAKN